MSDSTLTDVEFVQKHYRTTDIAEAIEKILDRYEFAKVTVEQQPDGTWHADTIEDMAYGFYGDGATREEAIINAERHYQWEAWCDANEYW